ncbi:MAG: ADP-ribosylglycohydrolase family protein [Armatimonadetes bacterium]|nr:ADP-ribosylglycohydrolase family protein [Armatimonadota bacterium]
MVDRYVGCILGLAVGDALGFPTEFMSLDDIRSRYGHDGISDFVSYHRFPLGTFTDDTQMSCALAEALLETRGADLDTVMAAVARRFVSWSIAPDNNRAPGMSCLSGCRALAAGVPWRTSGVPDSKGCGSAMRSAPIGLLHHGDLAAIDALGQATSLPTHGHACALAGSVATAVAVSLALDGVEPMALLDGVLAATEPISTEFARHLGRVHQALDLDGDQALALLGDGWVAEEAVAAALYCFLASPRDYRQTVLRAANSNGDSDSLACIAGAVSGAYNGLDAIPAAWRETVEKSDYLIDLGQRLWAASGA